jgi:hypothetical protein
MYSAGGDLVYVGVTNHLPKRLTQHRNDKPWWSVVTDVRIQHFDSRDEASAAEAVAIKDEDPLYNIAPGPRGDMKTRRQEVKAARAAAAAARAADLRERGVYEWNLKCHNCRRFGSVELPMGTLVADAVCPRCGVRHGQEQAA